MRAFLHRLPFALAITLVLVVKAVLLFMLYKAFFSAPQVKKMRMPTAQVEQHLLAAPRPAPAAPAPAPAPATATAPALTSTPTPAKATP